MYADLHIHSIFSDSSRSPEEIAQIAKSQDVSLLSVCDHYTVASYERLADACKQHGISCVVGVEMDANMHDANYHVLAYNFDKDNTIMSDFIKRQYVKNQNECTAMIAKMCDEYPQLSLAEYLAYDYPRELGGWKYIHYAVEKGIYKTYDDAGPVIYPKYFEASKETYLVEDFCSVVKQANGVPVLAHPGNKPPDQLVSFLRDMHERGIEGIECFYPSHSKETIETCLDYCHKNDLRITCGSDCHGAYDKSEGFTIGFLKTPLDMLDLKGIV